MKDVAETAGVSPSTVCRALNSNPQIPENTRKRIQQVADELGYRPDPLLSAFASRRRGRNVGSNVTTIAYVTNFSKSLVWKDNPFYERCYQGAKKRVEGLGYKLEHFWMGDPEMSPMRLSKILYNRGILGMFVAPMPHVREPVDMDWGKFSCATVGYSLMSPILHRSTPHHFHAMQETLKRLHNSGYKRIGLCIFSDTSRRVDELWLSGSLLAQNHRLLATGDTRKDFYISNFLFNDDTLKEVSAWCQRENLDVVISDNPQVMHELESAGFSVPGDVDFVTLNWEKQNSHIAGIDQRPEHIGAASMDLIIGSLQRGERGVPDVPLTTMVEGTWVDGPSLTKKLSSTL